MALKLNTWVLIITLVNNVKTDSEKSIMRSHYYITSMKLPLNIEKVFPFFCDVDNLQRITPPELHFRIITEQPVEIKKDTMVDYRLRLYGIPMGWRSKITAWEPPYKFVDEQIFGPYNRWIHTHLFREHDGETIIEDNVEYRLPFWPLGEIAVPLIHLQIRRIFSYRQRIIREYFCTD